MDRYFGKGGDLYEVDLPRFCDLFKKAHLPIREKIFFLCKMCHDRLDKTGDITPDDIRAVRGY